MTDELVIREVWAHNLEQEMAIIADLIDDYPFVAMDTEFPGTIAKPIGQFASLESFHYHTMRCNVDFLKIIQIGITLGDGEGRFPSPCCTWQFNFKFNLEKDMYATNAIELLQQSGIDFSRFNSDGINVFDFSQLLYTSGLIMNQDVHYITFHGNSDFGYLVKMLTCKPLPQDEKEFFRLLDILFPHFYDLKLMADPIEQVSSGGLQTMANELNVLRVGPQHQAGSDALVTLKTFTALKQRFFTGNGPRTNEFENRLYGVSERN
jgi:CCR4-NOT transcription complex subunit 7/8